MYSSGWTGRNTKSFRCNASTMGCQEHCWGKYGGPGTCIFDMGTLTGVEYKDLSIKNIYMNELLTQAGKAGLKCRHFAFLIYTAGIHYLLAQVPFSRSIFETE